MSEVVMNRVDDRLIHGQVITGWTKLRNVNNIMIVDDEVATNQMMLDIFRFAAPPRVKIEAYTVERAAEKLRNLNQGTDRIMLLTKLPKTFLRLIESGYKPTDINYGAMAHKPQSRNLAPNCDLSPEEIQDTEKLHQMGIRVWIQLVPFGGQKEVDWTKVRQKAGLS